MVNKIKANDTAPHTRKINPKLGILGLFGFLGFAGFIPRAFNLTDVLTAPSFFFFFAFFGFFGFYYEGKMSNTLIDERFQANRYRAGAIANRVSLTLLIVFSIIAMSVLRVSTYDMLSILISAMGLVFGLAIFLQPYLLYRFESED